MNTPRLIFFSVLIIALAGYSPLQSRQETLPDISLSLDQNPARVTGDAIAASEQHIAALVYKFEDKTILKSLQEALERGVSVRLLVDGKEASGKKSLAKKAKRAGADVRLWKPELGKLHAKCLIVDGQQVLTGSFNWTKSAAERNVELLISFQNPDTVKKFSALFERLWEKGTPVKDE
jgi:phosphatidylserine/phosphatidylglycerophosphate/cardiolipin synthase-like enzyme